MPLTAAENRDLIRTRNVLDAFAATVGLPDKVTEALETLDRVRGVQAPTVGNVAAEARREARKRIAAAVHAGKTPTVQDIEAVAEAAAVEQRTALLAELVDDVTVNAVTDVLDTVKASGDDIIRHAADALTPMFATVTEHAGEIPPGYDDAQAFRDPKRADVWREVSAAASDIIATHQARSSLRNLGIIRPAKWDAAGHFALIRNPYHVAPHLTAAINIHPSHTLAPTGRLPAAPVDRLLEEARRGADFWFPTTAEQDEHAYAVLSELARPAGTTPRARSSSRTLSTA